MSFAFRLMTASLLATLALATPCRAGSGGPDTFGYRWHDINDPRGCPIQADVFQLANPANFATNVIGPINLGFSFPFYDRLVSQVWFHQAGLVCFQAPPTAPLSANQNIPTNDTVGGFIAPYWGFLQLGSPNVYWESFLNDGYFKVSFNYARPLDGAGPLQFEVYLYRNGDIRIEYLRPGTGSAVTIGIESFDQRDGLQIRKDANSSGGLTYGTPTPFSICIKRPKYLDCAPATPISCNTPMPGTSPASVTSNVLQYGCGTGSWAGKERVYRLTVPDLSDLNIAVTGTGARVMAAWLLRGCDEYECLAGGSANFAALTVTPGTYYVVVDALARADEGAFTLSVTCTPLSDPIACGETLADTTVGQPGRLDNYPCLPGDMGGSEQFYSVNFVPPGNLNVTVASGTGQAAFIFDPNLPLAANNCLVGGVGGTVLFGPPAGTYLIAVDGPAGGNGPFNISLSCQPEISCSPPAASLACQASVSGSTIGVTPRADFYRCTTVQYDGPELVYEFVNPVQQTVSFVLTTTEPGLDLILLETCNEGDCVEIGDTSISKELPPGTYYVVVDGRGGASGTFTLSTICGFGLDPAVLSVTGAAGECFTERKTAWMTPEIVQADILFGIDLTGSMSGVRSQLQANMNDIIDRVQVFIQDVAFGLVSYKDYPNSFPMSVPCSYSQAYGGGTDYAYLLHQPMTTDRTQIENAVNALPPASGGGDLPESSSRMLHEAAADPGIAWRTNSRRLLVAFGDDMPHDCNVLACLGGTASSRGLDPGRDNTVGTADDLAILDVVQGLVDNQIVLLHLTNSAAGEGGFSFNEIWDCWSRLTGGQGSQLNGNGTVPSGIDLAELVADLIRAQGSRCTELRLRAEAGFESWVTLVTPTYTDVTLPTMAQFDITFCVPAGTPPGPYSFVVELLCGDQVVTTQTVNVDVTIDCSTTIVSRPRDASICQGDSTMLDASGMTVVNCAGSAVYEWRDGAGTLVGSLPTLTVSPATTTTYTVTVSCSADPACSASASATVSVESRPVLGTGLAEDPYDCNLGLSVSWDAAAFPGAPGSYNVYRSEVSCADALTRPPISAPGLTATRFVDGTTRHGRTYYYAVQAESPGLAGPCRPAGPANGGVVSATTLCLGPVTEIDNPGFPDFLGWSLRVSHLGQQVTLDWTGGRALVAGEHYHVTKGTDPQVLGMVNAENQIAETHVETDTSARLQFFDVRIANSCEEVSLDDEPPGWDAGR